MCAVIIIPSKCITVFLSQSSVICHQVVNLPRFIKASHSPLQILFHRTILWFCYPNFLLLIYFFKIVFYYSTFHIYWFQEYFCPILGFQDFHFLCCVYADVSVLTSTFQGVNHRVPHYQSRSLNVRGLFIQNVWENHLSLKIPLRSVTKLFLYGELVRFFLISTFP